MTRPRDPNRKLVLKLLAVAVLMFAFGVFAMPPLYDKFCEFTGIGQAGVKIADVAPGADGSTRSVKVRFDANSNSALNWSFRPLQKSLDVVLGEPTEALYVATNREDRASTGMAVFNVSPPAAARYFVKTECFCFTEQLLSANEQRQMSVYFFVQPDLPAHIGELTLSYTFFRNDDDDVAQATP